MSKCGSCGKNLPSINLCECGYITPPEQKNVLEDREGNVLEDPVGSKVSTILDWLRESSCERLKMTGTSDDNIPFMVLIAVGDEAKRLLPGVVKLTSESKVLKDEVIPVIDLEVKVPEGKTQCPWCDVWVEPEEYPEHIGLHYEES